MNPKNNSKSLKQRFDERELPLSDNAWERMEHLLESTHQKRSRKSYGIWMWSAAAIVIALGIGVYFQTASSGTPTLSNPGIVSEEQEEQEEQEGPIFDASSPLPDPVRENKTDRAVVHIPKTDAVEKSKAPVLPTPESTVDTNTTANLIVDAVEENLPVVPDLQDQIDAEVDKLLAQFNTPQAIISATDTEVDSLLRAAQQQIVFRNIRDQSTEALASSLLEHVETELDQTFKDQVFEALRASFVKAKNAVVMNED